MGEIRHFKKRRSRHANYYIQLPELRKLWDVKKRTDGSFKKFFEIDNVVQGVGSKTRF
jgi:hypothetical protein